MFESEFEWPKDAWLSKNFLLKVVSSVIAAEIAASRGTDMQRLRPDQWTSDIGMIDTGLCLDSLERTNCAAALNQFFHLSDYGAEDYLLAGETLADWVSIVAISIANGSGQITFETSGSTGTPKPCTHSIDALQREVGFWADHFADRTQIISLVPPHHIYGFLFAALLPEALDIPLVDCRHSGASALNEALETPGALIVGAPVHWRYVARSFLRLPENVEGVTSTAPMPHQLAEQLNAQGLARLTEVYGSSETAGVGFRSTPNAPYQLLPYWSLRRDGEDSALIGDGGAETSTLMDNVLPGPSEDQFTVQGRKDGAVQVGGINVFPRRIADLLSDQPGVGQCAIKPSPSNGRLSAFIVPSDPNEDEAALEERLRAYCAAALSPSERPTSYRFGAAIPVTEMGKVANW